MLGVVRLFCPYPLKLTVLWDNHRRRAPILRALRRKRRQGAERKRTANPCLVELCRGLAQSGQQGGSAVKETEQKQEGSDRIWSLAIHSGD